MESLVALAEIGPESASALDDIMALVHPGGDPTFRPVACYALGRIGKASKPAIPLLHRLVQSRDRVEKTVAAWALVKIEPNAEIIGIAIPLLATAVQEAVRPEMRVVAAETLGEIGAGSGAARDALVKAQKDSDESVRKAADAALKQLK